jgi:hypothetical protein
MRKTCTYGSVGGEGGNILTYPAIGVRTCATAPSARRFNAGYVFSATASD